MLDSPRCEHVARAHLDARAKLEEPVQLEQFATRLALEVPPAGERLLGEHDPVLLRIGEPKDPSAAVARPARMAVVELLVQRDVGTARGKRPRGGGAHDTRPDDRDLRHCAATMRFRNTPISASETSTVSPAPKGPLRMLPAARIAPGKR